jgi:hypothetical protein
VFEPAFLLHQSRSPDCFWNILSILTYSNIVSRFQKGKCEPMNKLFALRRTLLLLPLLALPGVRVNAQSPPSTAPHDELFRTIASLDSALFDSYNGCDLERFKTFLTDDVEFYHDQSGLTVGARTVAEQVEKNICGKARRELVAGTLQVYPMRGYGAVEIGVHRFYQPKKSSEPTGEGKFIHLWQEKEGVWKITRIISYDHVSVGK